MAGEKQYTEGGGYLLKVRILNILKVRLIRMVIVCC